MLIALTGGIASGKSTVAEVWRGYGAEIVDADQIAREVVSPNSRGLAMVVSRFGEEILKPDGSLNREALGDRVFGDETARKDLEQILHPLIRAESSTRFATSTARHIVYAIPLLVESGQEHNFDKVCTVSAPARVRIERLVKYRRMTELEAIRRVGAQVSDSEREAVADVVIDSDCTLPELNQRAAMAWFELTGEPQIGDHGA